MKLQFTYSCEEPDSSMTSVQEGVYCLKCEKTVVNITSMGRAEIEQLLHASNGEVCGQFFADQLSTPSKNRGLTATIALALSSTLAIVTPDVGIAQTPQKTEQAIHPGYSEEIKETDVREVDPSMECADGVPYIELREEPEPRKTYRRLFRVGRYYFYASRRLPFIHIPRRLRGRISPYWMRAPRPKTKDTRTL